MSNDLDKFTKCDIFTPDNITKIMTSKLKKKGTLLEPSVGTGNLLKFINPEKYNSIDVYELKKDYLDKVTEHKHINKFNGDFIKTNIEKRYDNIIMNPPYIKTQDMSLAYREFIKEKFNVLKTGLIDIYYAFIIKCLELLDDDGVMVSITPNTYLYNKSSLEMRKYLIDNKFIKEIIDFKHEKVFKDASVYCCITVFTKNDKSHVMYNNEKLLYSDISKNYSLFNFNSTSETLKNLCKIKNGVATLRDSIFIHSEKLFDEPCWKNITNGPNEKYIIYPYYNGEILNENTFKNSNPKTYKFLLENKDELAKRDKGNKTYPAWYAYGRSQSIKISDKTCIYIPCFIDPKNIKDNIFKWKNTLHRSCLCIEPNDEKNINEIIACIIDNIDFITKNSSKKSGGWINLSSRTLYEIPLS